MGATAGELVAFAIMAGGSLDTAPRSLNHALVDTPPTAEYDCPRRLRTSIDTATCSMPPPGRSNPKLTNVWQMSFGPHDEKKRSAVRIRSRSNVRSVHRGSASESEVR